MWLQTPAFSAQLPCTENWFGGHATAALRDPLLWVRGCREYEEAWVCKVPCKKEPRVLWLLDQGQCDKRLPPSEPNLIAGSAPRAPKVDLGSLRRVVEGCLGQGFIQGTVVYQAPPRMDSWLQLCFWLSSHFSLSWTFTWSLKRCIWL